MTEERMTDLGSELEQYLSSEHYKNVHEFVLNPPSRNQRNDKPTLVDLQTKFSPTKAQRKR